MTRRGTAMSEPGRCRPWRRVIVLLYAAMLLSLLCETSAAWPAGALYGGPATDPAFTLIAPRLLNALYPEQRLNAMAVANSTAALERVAADPSSAALADLATMVAFAAAKNLAPDRLEFHGPLEQHCLLAFSRRDGWVHSFSDIVTTSGTPRPAIGLAGPDAADLVDILRRLEPGLASITVQPPADVDTVAE